MTETDDMEIPPPDAISALDRFATNVGLAILGVVPTLFIAIFMPWKLVGHLSGKERIGRHGLFLAPGAYFIFAVIIAMAVGSQGVVGPDPAVRPAADGEALDTDAVETDALISLGVVIGSDQAAEVVSQLRDGNAAGALFAVVPIYLLVVFVSAATAWLRPLVGEWWDVATSIRAGFYYFASAIFIGITTAVTLPQIDFPPERLSRIGDAISFALFLLIIWMYTAFFEQGGGVSRFKSAFYAALAAGTFFLALAVVTFAVQVL